MKIFQISRLQDYEYKYTFFSTLKAAKDFVKKDYGFGYKASEWFSDKGIWVYEGEPTYVIKEYVLDKEVFM